MVITTQLTKSIESYDLVGPHVVVAKKMQEKGIFVGPGSIIKYIVAEGSGRIRDKAFLPEECRDYDSEYYINNQVIPSVERIFDALGYSEEELIKSKDAINTREVSGLVTKIQVRPGEVKMDEVAVKTVDKSVVARINDKDLEIKPTRAQVIMHDGDLEIKAPELSIEDEVLKVGNSEVKLVPSTVLKKLKVEAKEMELIEENSRAVYKIKTDEKRKLLGFIPLKVKNTLTVDATNTDTEIIKEEKPWWAFLTTK